MSKTADLLTVEVGSTFTKLTYYDFQDGRLIFGGRVSGRTTIESGDVSIGYQRLLKQLNATCGVGGFRKSYLSSSAAGGLRIVVCGLTRNLTTKAATESALGAGGIVLKRVTGLISADDAAEVVALQPNLILLCGGLNDGEATIPMQNAKILAGLPLDGVIVYAGNEALQGQVEATLAANGKQLLLSDNVYPEPDQFRFHEVQHIIRQAFETEVTKAPGIEKIQQDAASLLPTPLAVSQIVELLGKTFGNLLVFDVGGATTDLHSYINPLPPTRYIQATLEPPIKRTVEGDLGVFHNLAQLLDPDEASFQISSPTDPRLNLQKYARKACRKALQRHCGRVSTVHTGSQLVKIVYGRDLSTVQTMIGTGGALIYGLQRDDALRSLTQGLTPHPLMPTAVQNVALDRQYLLSSLGLLAQDYPKAVIEFAADYFGLSQS